MLSLAGVAIWVGMACSSGRPASTPDVLIEAPSATPTAFATPGSTREAVPGAAAQPEPSPGRRAAGD
jgi:hypothetical protein